MLTAITNTAALISLFIASISDLRTREVPDWLSYATIFFGFGVRIIASAVMQSWQPLIAGILGFIAFVIVALVMFYTGQWGGGDSKLLMGIGVLLGLNPTLTEIPLLLIFWINSVVAGAVFGLGYSFYLALRNQRKFLRAFRKRKRESRLAFIIFIAAALLFCIASFFFQDPLVRSGILLIASAPVLTFYLWLFVKSVEESAMIKFIPIEKLTEGDWIVDEVKIDGKYVCGPKDLGIENKQIEKLLKLKHKGKISR
ncbi:A24 family peptidase, partial [Candidatus Woesearchaeota archaeon]|nr:A24 family peptidase [Candidatus Woesearchaeota archaeon]